MGQATEEPLTAHSQKPTTSILPVIEEIHNEQKSLGKDQSKSVDLSAEEQESSESAFGEVKESFLPPINHKRNNSEMLQIRPKGFTADVLQYRPSNRLIPNNNQDCGGSKSNRTLDYQAENEILVKNLELI